ncbi:hypothetical protein NDU88_007362 [Pleurodeles waltl]|uniref:Uncharacterized protein n=1 Tax=Pleurodeles waltl TaxID=8319 RepID=A0AAV7RPA6_PLEWA|nr:hypothetical protein NDU88_007362 [Pleurodeles waltl]
MTCDKDPRTSIQGKLDRYARALFLRTGEAEQDPPRTPDNTVIVQVIQSSHKILEKNMGKVRSEVFLLRQGLRNVADRASTEKNRISELENMVQTLRKEVTE